MDAETAPQHAANFFDYALFHIGETPITLISIAIFVLTLIVFSIISRVLRMAILKKILVRMEVDQGMRFTFQRLTHYSILLLGTLIAFQNLGINLSGLVVVFGFLSVGIGFGLQNIVSNFISGLIILFEQPIRVGDRVTVGETEGDVMEVNMRSTTVKSLNNISIIVPNHDFITSQVVNWSHEDPKIRLDISVGVSYDSDLDTVIRCLREAAMEHPDALAEPAPDVLLTNFGDSAWDMLVRVWIGNPKRHPEVRSEIHCSIVRKFRANNIEIPYPQRDVHFRSPLPVPLTNAAE